MTNILKIVAFIPPLVAAGALAAFMLNHAVRAEDKKTETQTIDANTLVGDGHIYHRVCDGRPRDPKAQSACLVFLGMDAGRAFVEGEYVLILGSGACDKTIRASWSICIGGPETQLPEGAYKMLAMGGKVTSLDHLTDKQLAEMQQGLLGWIQSLATMPPQMMTPLSLDEKKP